MKHQSFVVITENDTSNWEDSTGALYHYPKRYEKYLEPGTLAIYYKGRMRDRDFINERLTPEPHYFGLAKIGKSYPDKNSEKGDLFATIEDFRPFKEPY